VARDISGVVGVAAMTESQFAIIACALLTIAIVVGPAWQAVLVFFAALISWVACDWVIER
jgi:hypothetical protein